MMALLKSRWAREAEEARIAEMNRKTVKVYTIQTTKEDPPSYLKMMKLILTIAILLKSLSSYKNLLRHRMLVK